MIARVAAAVLFLVLLAGCQSKNESVNPTLEEKVDQHNQQLLRDGPASPPSQR